MELILAVGHRVRSARGTQFRQWATAQLGEYLVKDFAMDDERLKQAGGGFDELLARIRDIRSSERVFWRKVLDIYATSADYDPSAEASQKSFAVVQNKMHWAAQGHTAAEVIARRADATRPHMGMIAWSAICSTTSRPFQNPKTGKIAVQVINHCGGKPSCPPCSPKTPSEPRQSSCNVLVTSRNRNAHSLIRSRTSYPCARACAICAIPRTIFVVLRTVAFQVCLAVLAAFCGAPFQHFHVHDYTEHVNRDHGTDSATPHGHFGFRACGGPESRIELCAEDGDDDAIFLNWFQDKPNPQPAFAFETVECPVLQVPAPAPARVAELTCRSHDPPSLRPRNSRAPPSPSFPRGVLTHAV